MDSDFTSGEYRRDHGRYPLYDPLWVRRAYTLCLWDGAPRRRGSEFCSTRCEEHYAEWEEAMTSHYVSREPLETIIALESDL